MTDASCYAIVLAGDRGPDDAVARATGAPCKALSPVAGTPMLWRVLNTLKQVAAIEKIILVGPTQEIMHAKPELARDLEKASVTWLAPGASPSASAALGLAQLPDDKPVLLTTADHAMLRADTVTSLLAANGDCDLAVGMVAYEQVVHAYPGTRRTALRLRPGAGYCGCNLFLINNTQGRKLVERWRRVEARRKHPARLIIGMLGWGAVIRYLCGRLRLADAFTRLSRRLDIRVKPILLDDPSAAIDVDTPADLALVESLLENRPQTRRA